MRILIVGSGGREHALAWAIGASPLVTRLICAPGNAGIAQEAELAPIAVDDIDGLVAFARAEAIDLVVVGPEGPLVAGLVDRLTEAGVMAFGPTAAAAALEGSKTFTKEFCQRHGIPTARAASFTDAAAARAYIADQGAPIVVKADGLAAGKGVTVAQTVDDALAAVDEAFQFGDVVLVEEKLDGPEVSVFALTDGEAVLPFATAQDHKRAFDGDQGPNTGGMGAFSPSPLIDAEMLETVMARIIRPTVSGMAAEGRPFRGVLYAGLMMTAEGPKLLEYNTRLGDPEAQALVMRLKSDLLPALIATAEGQLRHFDLRWDPRPSLCVVMASEGYPGPLTGGGAIHGLEALEGERDLVVFHAATQRTDNGIEASGGRVLGVTALGTTLEEARARAYRAIDRVAFPGGFYRRDIGISGAGTDGTEPA